MAFHIDLSGSYDFILSKAYNYFRDSNPRSTSINFKRKIDFLDACASDRIEDFYIPKADNSRVMKLRTDTNTHSKLFT